MSRYSVVRSMYFSVARRALVDLRGAGASTSGGTTYCTSYILSVGAEIFLGIS
jgi:hypothetical protein